MEDKDVEVNELLQKLVAKDGEIEEMQSMQESEFKGLKNLLKEKDIKLKETTANYEHQLRVSLLSMHRIMFIFFLCAFSCGGQKGELDTTNILSSHSTGERTPPCYTPERLVKVYNMEVSSLLYCLICSWKIPQPKHTW